jgi:hypothetical protein
MDNDDTFALIEKLHKINPKLRITNKDTLKHPFFELKAQGFFNNEAKAGDLLPDPKILYIATPEQSIEHDLNPNEY